MKVICIDAGQPKHSHLLNPEHFIKEGEAYTVCGAYVDSADGHEYYYLTEKRIEPVASYRANRFVPLSNICEEDEYRIRMAMLTGRGI
jgi:hypothetical protein